MNGYQKMQIGLHKAKFYNKFTAAQFERFGVSEMTRVRAVYYERVKKA